MTAWALPVSPMVVDRWIRAGLLRLERPGSGYRRPYPEAERRAIVALDMALHHGSEGVDPISWSPSRRALLATVAEVARSHPAGTAHEITSPVPWIRHVLIVPEP